MNEDKQNLDKDYCNRCEECSDKCKDIKGLESFIDKLANKTIRLYDKLSSENDNSNSFIQCYLNMVNELVLKLGTTGTQLAKANKKLANYDRAKPYIRDVASAINYDGLVDGKKAVPLSLKWYEGLAKAVADRMKANPQKDAKIADLETRLNKMDLDNTELRRIIAEQVELLEQANARLENYNGAASAEGGN